MFPRWAIQHRTSRRYLAKHPALAHAETPRVGEATQFVNKAEAIEALGAVPAEFASAFAVVPLVGLEWPERFPGAWQDWPVELQRAAARFLLDQWLADHGPADLVKMLCVRGSRINPDDAQVVAYTDPPEAFWPIFLHQARAYHTARVVQSLNEDAAQ